MLTKEFEKMIGIVEGLTSPETKITDFKLSRKILKLKRWYDPILEEYQAGATAINTQVTTFGLNKFGGYLSGSKEDYEKYQNDVKEFLNSEVENCDIKFKEDDFENCTVNLSILSKMEDAKLI